MIATIRNIAICSAIAMLLPMLVHVGTQLIIHEPTYPAETATSHEEEEAKLTLYDKERKEWDKKNFMVSAIIGLFSLTLGILVLPTPQLSIGFIFGGTFCLVSGYIGHWNYLNHELKFVSLLIALIILILGGLNWPRKTARK